MTRIIIHGCAGRMGRTISRLAQADDSFTVAAGVDEAPFSAEFPVFKSFDESGIPAADVIIDFSMASAVAGVLKYALKTKTPLIVCTTGLDENLTQEINRASESIPLFLSANMSVGVSLLKDFVRRAASVLSGSGLGFDIEIVERHHNQKIDAPSGTALALGKAVNESLPDERDFVYGRSAGRKARSVNEIGFHSIRGGTIAGEHSVIFAGRDEVLELTHKAASRELFASGALKAAGFLSGKPPGMYDMDVLLKDMLKDLD